MSRATTKNPRAPLWLAALLVISGVALLLHNLLLLGDFNLVSLLPLLLVVVGAQILLKGDLVPSQQTRAFRITRGNIERASLRANSAEIDLRFYPLPSEAQEYLIAGQYAPQTRPQLSAEGASAQLTFDRAQTRWFHWADWDIGLAQNMPWEIFASTSLGQIEADCTGLIVADVRLYSGIGDIRLTSPQELIGEPIELYATLGNVQVIIPPAYNAQITILESRFFKARVDTARFALIDDQTYAPYDANPEYPPVHIVVRGAFGDAYLA